jgi:hypothetical protein
MAGERTGGRARGRAASRTKEMAVAAVISTTDCVTAIPVVEASTADGV